MIGRLRTLLAAATLDAACAPDQAAIDAAVSERLDDGFGVRFTDWK